MPFYRNAHIHLHIRLIFGNQVNQKLLFPRRLRQQHKKKYKLLTHEIRFGSAYRATYFGRMKKTIIYWK